MKKHKVFAIRYLTIIALLLLQLSYCQKAPSEFNVLLLSLDTTRSDHIDTGQSARAYTPGIREFAKKAVVFERAYSTIPQTLPSHLALLTSYFPHQCGVFSNEFKYDGRHPMLQERLKARGYSTAAVVSLGTLSSTTGLNRGFDHYIENLNEKGVFYATAEKVTATAAGLLEKMAGGKFFMFLHYSDPHSPYSPPSAKGEFQILLDGKQVEAFPAHQGAIPRIDLELPPGNHEISFRVKDSPGDFEGFALRKLKFSANCSVDYRDISFSTAHYDGSHIMKGMEARIQVSSRGKGRFSLFQVIPMLNWDAARHYYRMEVEYMDRQIGKLLLILKKKNLLKKTIVVITGDHGEGLGERERYFGHVRYLNQQFIHVPLIVYAPGITHRIVKEPVSLVSVTPTILDLLGEKMNKDRAHLSLKLTLKGKKKPDETIYSFAFSPSSREDKLSIINWPYQAIFIESLPFTTEKEWYKLDLSQSFRKLDSLAVDLLIRDSRQNYLTLHRNFQKMNRVFRLKANGPARVLDIKETEKLESLGYLR